jgi:hypothetical protein
MLYREIIAVCSQIHTKHTNTLCGQKAECCNSKPSRQTVTLQRCSISPPNQLSVLTLRTAGTCCRAVCYKTDETPRTHPTFLPPFNSPSVKQHFQRLSPHSVRSKLWPNPPFTTLYIAPFYKAQFFHPEDEARYLYRNVGTHVSECTTPI